MTRWGYLVAGYIYVVSRKTAPALEELDAAIARNPSFALGEMILGLAYAYAGRAATTRRSPSSAAPCTCGRTKGRHGVR